VTSEGASWVTGSDFWVVTVNLVIWTGIFLYLLRLAMGGRSVSVKLWFTPLAVGIVLLVTLAGYFLGVRWRTTSDLWVVAVNLLIWTGIFLDLLLLHGIVRSAEEKETQS